MNCNYILENEIHEKYLLQHLSKDEQKAYLTHLQLCEKCSRDLENERLLINGLRNAGHKQMKAEIRRQIAGTRASAGRLDWGIILKAAAVLLVAVLLPALYFTQSDYSAKSISSESAVKTPPLEELRIYEQEKTAPLLEGKSETKATKRSMAAGSAKKRAAAPKLKTVAGKHASGPKTIPPLDKISPLGPALSGRGASSSAKTVLKKEAASSLSIQAHKPAFQQRTFRFKDKIFVTRFFSEGKRMAERNIVSDSLHVEINTRNGRKFLLNCYLPAKLSRVNRDSIQVDFLNDKSLMMLFPDSTHYKIRLQKAPVQVIAPANK